MFFVVVFALPLGQTDSQFSANPDCHLPFAKDLHFTSTFAAGLAGLVADRVNELNNWF